MKLSEFHYDLPRELIAQEGLEKRDSSRLLVLHPDGEREHKAFRDLKNYLRSGDLLILNDTRVLPAKLLGQKESGGKVDCLLLPQTNGKVNVRECFLRGSGFKPGTKIFFKSEQAEGTLEALVTENISGAKFKLEFKEPEKIAGFGQMPLPPYIKQKLGDQDRYQTVFSKNQGSLAAPTAGLHFTPEFMEELKSMGVDWTFLTLHVGIGTFATIHAENVEDWKMHPEVYEVSETSAQKINDAVKAGRRVFAVGTTSVRTLESVTDDSGKVQPGTRSTDIFIYPGYRFKFPYSGMLTNFHLPESTLLLLVSALAGREKILETYKEAVEKKYRFFSLGDAMLILR